MYGDPYGFAAGFSLNNTLEPGFQDFVEGVAELSGGGI